MNMKNELVEVYRGWIIRWYEFEDKRLYDPSGEYKGMHYHPKDTIDRQYNSYYGECLREAVKNAESRSPRALATLCTLLGWKGGTVYQAIEEAKLRLKA